MNAGHQINRLLPPRLGLKRERSLANCFKTVFSNEAILNFAWVTTSDILGEKNNSDAINERGITDGRQEDLPVGGIHYSAWISGRGEGHLQGGSYPDAPGAGLRS